MISILLSAAHHAKHFQLLALVADSKMRGAMYSCDILKLFWNYVQSFVLLKM